MMGRRQVHFLVDAGSSHNFLDTTLAKELSYKITTTKPMYIEVASGHTMMCNQCCEDVSWNMQGENFQTNFFVVPMEGAEVVLGIPW